MTKLLNILPLLAVFSLLINPALLLLYRRWEINTQKLPFWFMTTSALSWILLLLSLLLGLEAQLNLGWNSTTPLLADPIMVFDWISNSIAFALSGLVLYATICQVFSAQQSAWISGLGAVCILGTYAGSIFTILFVWTLIEVFWIIYSVLYQSRDRGLILPVLFRLLVPLILIYASVIGKGESTGESFSTFTAAAGPVLIAAGGLGFGAWIPFRRRETTADPGGNAEFLARIFPAGISLMLICRGALLLESNDIEPLVSLLLSIFTLILGIIGLFSYSRGFSHRIWSLGILGLIIGNALIPSSAGTLGWGLVFMLAVTSIFISHQDKLRAYPALIIAGVGLIPLPFLPAWLGVDLFFDGAAGLFYGIGAGLILGSILRDGVNRASEASQSNESIPILYRFSPVIRLFTQFIIVVPLTLLKSENGIFSQSVMVWIPIPLIVLVIAFRDRISEQGFIQIKGYPGRSFDFVPDLFSSVGSFGDRIVSFISGLFEGEGGLIWALLIGFLLITLITIRGGS